MLCYRCGSHVQDGAERCWNCATKLGATQGAGAPVAQARERQKTKSRLSGVVYKIGDTISGRYQVRDIVGSGGAGVVYRAHDQEIDVDVALKVINAKLLQTDEEAKLFAKELRTARKLSHQNIVRIYGDGRDEDRSFFTMQFLEGLSLRKIIDLRKEKRQHFKLSEVEPIFNQLCQALEYAHKTAAHGDLKPDNILVLPDLLKVTDFGLIRSLPRKPFLAIQKARSVNLRYLAPEVRNEVDDLQSPADLYSLGVILAEMLAGDVYEETKPELLSVAETGLDPNMLRVIKRAVSRAPKERYPNAQGLYEDLRNVLARGDVESKKSVPPPALKPAAPPPAVPEPGAVAAPPPEAPPPAARVQENPAEAPTQRLDIGKHGARPIRDPSTDGPPPAPEPSQGRADPRPPPALEGTGSYAQIDDDMIESAHAGAPDAGLEVPPLASERPPSVADESSEAIEGLMEISASQIQLIADPRATNVIGIGEKRQAELAQMSGAPERQHVQGGGTVSPPTPKGDAPMGGKVIVDLRDTPNARPPHERSPFDRPSAPPPASSVPPPPAIPPRLSSIPPPLRPERAAQAARERTEAGRLDLGSAAPAAASAPVQAPTEGLLDPGDPRPNTRGIPRRGSRPGPPLSGAEAEPQNGSPKAAVQGTNGRSAKARPMTRPRMAAMPRASANLGSTSLYEPGAGGAAASLRPLSLDDRGIQRLDPAVSPKTARDLSSTRFLRPDGRNTALWVMGMMFVAVLGLVGFVFKTVTDQSTALAQLQEQMKQERELALAAKQKQAVATQEAAQATSTAKAAEEAENKARIQAEEAARRREEALAAAKRAEDEAKTRADDPKRKEAEEKRRVAEAEAENEREARARVDSEREKKERAEQAAIRAERRAEQERLAAARSEEKAARLREKTEERERSKVDAERRTQERAEVDRAKKDELAAKDQEKKAAEEEKRQAEAEKREAEKREQEAAKVKDGEGATAASAAAIAPEASGSNKCPAGMAFLEAGAFMMGSPGSDPERNFDDQRYQSTEVAGFCMDYYEGPNRRAAPPVAKVNFAAAEKKCKAKKKRLCTEAEWEKACKGPSGRRYPYGNQWDPEKCATEDDEGNDREVAGSGEYKNCRSGYNVFDLSGNIGEWTATAWPSGGGYVVKGGSADRPGYDGRCAARKKKNPNEAAATLGYRCCADPS